MNERYPLHAAERLRTAQRGQAERELAEAHAQCAEARAAVEAAERALHAHAGRAPGIEAGEAPEVITALELQRAAAFAQRHADEARGLRERCAVVRQRLAMCENALRQAQEALGRARASEDAIERNHARFDAAQRREQEHVEQFEVEEGLVRSRKERGR